MFSTHIFFQSGNHSASAGASPAFCTRLQQLSPEPHGFVAASEPRPRAAPRGSLPGLRGPGSSRALGKGSREEVDFRSQPSSPRRGKNAGLCLALPIFRSLGQHFSRAHWVRRSAETISLAHFSKEGHGDAAKDPVGTCVSECRPGRMRDRSWEQLLELLRNQS